MIPGEYFLEEGDIEANAGRATGQVTVANTGTGRSRWGRTSTSSRRTRRCAFDRGRAWGMRLDIPAGTAVRFEPGDEKVVPLVALAGAREVHGLTSLADGPTDEAGRAGAIERAAREGYLGAGA